MFERSAEVALNYLDRGDGPPVLLIHGVGSDLESWDGVLARLSPERRYVRFDLRGHGGSRRTRGPCALSDFVADAVALLDHLTIGRASIVGFSLGGLIAQAIALAHPDRVRSLILISTVGGRTADERARVEERAEMLAREGASAHLVDAVDRWFTPEFVSRHPEVIEARRRKSMKNDPDCYASAYRILAGNDLGERLHELSMPVLIMTGENDVGSNPRMARFMHDRIAGSELHILPRLKHSVLLEAPARVAGLIDPFLSTRADPQPEKQGDCTQR